MLRKPDSCFAWRSLGRPRSADDDWCFAPLTTARHRGCTVQEDMRQLSAAKQASSTLHRDKFGLVTVDQRYLRYE